MSYAGETADQVVRMSLNGVEVAARISGAAAERLARLIYAVLKDQKKTRGKARLTSMLRSGRELKVFAVRDEEVKLFCREARKYGVLYCVLKDRMAEDGLTDVMVRGEDAGKVSRIFDRFELSRVDAGSVLGEIRRDREEEALFPPEAKEDGLAWFDEVMRELGMGGEELPEDPAPARPETSRPSGPSSERRRDSRSGRAGGNERARPSVREELRRLRERQERREAAADAVEKAAGALRRAGGEAR